MSTTETFAERIAAAAKILNTDPAKFSEEFNARIGFTEISDLDSADFKFGDFLKRFEERPIGLIRKAFATLKGGKSEDQTCAPNADPRLEQLKSFGLKVRLEDADLSMLLPLYLPDKPSDPVTLTLKKRLGDKPSVAFHEDGTVAVSETLQYLSDLEQRYPEQETIMVNNYLAKLYPIGIQPEQMVEEDPLFPGQPLRNGCSLVNKRNWTLIPHEQRQMCRILVTRGDVDPYNKEAVLRLMERATGLKWLKDIYPEAWLEFRTLRSRDELPKLKIQLGAAKSNNPFGVPRRY